MTILDKIQSLRDATGGVYIKPNKDKMSSMVESLKNSTRAMDYLVIERGFSQETIQHFNLGYDSERDAIAIPVYKRGELINIRYRFIDPPKNRPKYTQEKGAEVWMYHDEGIDEGKKKSAVLIVEGEFDLMSAWQAGIKHVISPASGKDSYGVWIEYLDSIPRVYIAYDNDKPGKTAAINLGERLGVDKCYEVQYPDGIKDANDFFKKHTIEDFRNLVKDAKPFFKYTFEGIPEIIKTIRTQEDVGLILYTIPNVKIEPDWLVIVSGMSNAGKTTYALNIASELADKNIPTLVLPFERGTKTVGKRFLQVRYEKEDKDFATMSDSDWTDLIKDAVNLPVYFSMPKNEEVRDIIIQSKKIFNTRVVIVDHLNYLVRRSENNENVEVSRTMQDFKSIAQEHNIIFIIVHHIKKQSNIGVKRRPGMEDLKGSSSIYQDPECVIMLSSDDVQEILIDVVKNKGPMGDYLYPFNPAHGKIQFKKKVVDPLPNYTKQEADEEFEKW